MRNLLMLVVILAGLLLAACQPVSPEQANADFCADLTAYKAAVDNLSTLTGESTVEEAQAAFDAVDDARDNLANSARILADINVDEVDEAYEDLDDSIRGIESGETISDAVTSIATQVEAVNAAYDNLFSSDCQ